MRPPQPGPARCCVGSHPVGRRTGRRHGEPRPNTSPLHGLRRLQHRAIPASARVSPWPPPEQVEAHELGHVPRTGRVVTSSMVPCWTTAPASTMTNFGRRWPRRRAVVGRPSRTGPANSPRCRRSSCPYRPLGHRRRGRPWARRGAGASLGGPAPGPSPPLRPARRRAHRAWIAPGRRDPSDRARPSARRLASDLDAPLLRRPNATLAKVVRWGKRGSPGTPSRTAAAQAGRAPGRRVVEDGAIEHDTTGGQGEQTGERPEQRDLPLPLGPRTASTSPSATSSGGAPRTRR